MATVADFLKFIGINCPTYSEVYPVGSIYMSVNSTSPATLFGGTWERIQDKFLLAAGTTYEAGGSGGSADAVVVSHNHMQNAHNHLQNSHNHTQNAHNHKPLNPDGTSPKFISTDKNYTTTSARAYTSAQSDGVRYMVTTETGASHVSEDTTTANATATNNGATATNQSATATNIETGVSGTGKNMPPYLSVYVWKRTA